MRVLLLSWMYPPRLVGELGRHVHRLSVALAARVDDVHVVAATQYPPLINDTFSWDSIARWTAEVSARAITEEHQLQRGLRRDERVPLRAILGRSELLGLAKGSSA